MTASLAPLLTLGMAACSVATTPGPVHTGDTGPESAFLTLCEGAFEPPDLRLDCNADGVPDAETLASNPSLDQDTDGVLDTCQSPRQPILYGREHYVSYQPGELPIVLLAPHGGTLLPEEIPERESSPPADLYTFELATALADALEQDTGLRPHLVACHLHRSRLDCNRSLSVGAEDNPFAQQAWVEFHGFVEQAKAAAEASYGQALVLDLHGMTRERIELGTLIDGSQWLVGDSRLDHEAYSTSSSIRHLSDQSGRSFSSLSRGPLSLGAELESRGHTVVPSPGHPDPGMDEEGSVLDYYEGGYNTVHHGSRHGGHSDAIQIEHPMALRETPEARFSYAADLSASLVSFFEEMSGIVLEHPTGIQLVPLSPSISEPGDKDGLLRVIRTGDVSTALTLPLRASGEALRSSDFNFPEAVTFNVGEHVVDVHLTGVDDALVEGPEHFSIRLEDGLPVQMLSGPASFWIADDESPSLWIEDFQQSPEEGSSFSLVLQRDFCDTQEFFKLDWDGEAIPEDFEGALPEDLALDTRMGVIEAIFTPSVDGVLEGAEELRLDVFSERDTVQAAASWSGWIADADLPPGMTVWWDFSHMTLPELDRVSQAPLLFLPLDSPPKVEANPSSEVPYWLALDGSEDVAVLEHFPTESSGFGWIEFQFRARPESANAYHYLWSHGGVGARSSLNIYLTSDGILRTGFRGQDDDWSYTHLDVDANLLDGEWHSYRLEIDWAAPEARVFLDGQLRATSELGAGGYERVEHVFLGGRSDLRESRHFWGDLAEVRLGSF